MKNIINLNCSLSPLENPWNIVEDLYTDVTFVVNGETFGFHQAMLAQQSSMLRDIFTKARCCKCQGVECLHGNGDVVLILDNVNVDIFKLVMEIVYDGCGKVPDDVDEFTSVVCMLNLDSFFIRDKRDQNGNGDPSTVEVCKDESEGKSIHDAAEATQIIEDEDFSITIQELPAYHDDAPVVPTIDPTKQDIPSSEGTKNETLKSDDEDEEVSSEFSDDFNYDLDDELIQKEISKREKKTIVVSDDDDIVEIETSTGQIRKPTDSVLNKSRNITLKPGDVERKNGPVINTDRKIADENLMKEDTDPSLNMESTLSEFTSLLRKKNLQVQQEIETISKTSISAENFEGKDFHAFSCPFDKCTYSSKRLVDFHNHLGTKHYKTKIQELYPDFFNKSCRKCNKTFADSGNYYAHMAKHENLPYMNKTETLSLTSKRHSEINTDIDQLKLMESKDKTDSYEANLRLLEEFATGVKGEVLTPLRDNCEDDILEITPPKRKSPNSRDPNVSTKKLRNQIL